MSCPDCTTGGLLPGKPTGTLSTQGAYLASGPSPGRAIILLTDGFGLPLKNSKILADDLAKELQCDVWVPDYFQGKLAMLPFERAYLHTKHLVFVGRPLLDVNALLLPDRAGVKMSIFQWLNFILKMIPRIPAFISSRPSVVDARISQFISTITAEKKYDKIGAVGYCYGGTTAIRLAATDLIQSVVICHPGAFSIPEAKAIKVPASWACAEDDLFFSPALRVQAEGVFSECKGTSSFLEYEFKDYKGTAHGFAARPNLEIPEVKEAFERAFQQTVDWFAKTLPV